MRRSAQKNLLEGVKCLKSIVDGCDVTKIILEVQSVKTSIVGGCKKYLSDFLIIVV